MDSSDVEFVVKSFRLWSYCTATRVALCEKLNKFDKCPVIVVTNNSTQKNHCGSINATMLKMPQVPPGLLWNGSKARLSIVRSATNLSTSKHLYALTWLTMLETLVSLIICHRQFHYPKLQNSKQKINISNAIFVQKNSSQVIHWDRIGVITFGLERCRLHYPNKSLMQMHRILMFVTFAASHSGPVDPCLNTSVRMPE